jgi:16S rRNA (cytosine1402-N4)-methyltransferase
LNGVSLNLVYSSEIEPKDFDNWEENGLNRKKIIIGTIGSQEIKEYIIPFAVFGVKDTRVYLDVSMEYQPENINSSFKKNVQGSSIINSSPLSELTRIFRELGEYPQAYRLAKEIIVARKHETIKTTKELVDIIIKITPARFLKTKIHPATRVFQALRLATNDESASLKDALVATLDILKVGGRLAVVSFHSGEDRIVKQWLKRESLDCICPSEAPVCVCGHKARFKPIIRKPLMAGEQELKANPRSRSAKLRVSEKIS